MSQLTQPIAVVVPAAGIGSRMEADRPKQYLTIHGKTILEHTVERLLSHPAVDRVVVAISATDPYFPTLSLNTNAQVSVVEGGKERADSVLSGLAHLKQHHDYNWIMVHDAARPCLRLKDMDALITASLDNHIGGILAAPVRDTMKRGNGAGGIASTVERTDLWHALTPQMFQLPALYHALTSALDNGINVTDEASALEAAGMASALVRGRADNIKITQPEDLALAEFYLQRLDKETT